MIAQFTLDIKRCESRYTQFTRKVLQSQLLVEGMYCVLCTVYRVCVCASFVRFFVLRCNQERVNFFTTKPVSSHGSIVSSNDTNDVFSPAYLYTGNWKERRRICRWWKRWRRWRKWRWRRRRGRRQKVQVQVQVAAGASGVSRSAFSLLCTHRHFSFRSNLLLPVSLSSFHVVM